MLTRMFRFALAAVVVVAALWAAFEVLGWVLGAVVGAVLFAVKLGILAAVVLAGVWAYRKVRPRRRAVSDKPVPLDKGLDWQYIRGRIDKQTYLHRKTMSRLK